MRRFFSPVGYGEAILSLKGTSPSSASTELPEMPGATEREFVIFDEDERQLSEVEVENREEV